jgi:uncharacterized membrane protein YidH (DUF202 family)
MENQNTQQADLTMNDAFQVWWWIGWRTGLAVFVFDIAVGLFAASLNADPAITRPAIQGASLIIGILISVYLFKKGLSRKYKTFELIVRKF